MNFQAIALNVYRDCRAGGCWKRRLRGACACTRHFGGNFACGHADLGRVLHLAVRCGRQVRFCFLKTLPSAIKEFEQEEYSSCSFCKNRLPSAVEEFELLFI